MYNICNVDGIYEFHSLHLIWRGCNAQLSSINERLADIENLLWPPAPNSINVGDIVYWTGSERKTISPDRWISTLGTPIGVVTIPDGFAPDGKARMVALSGETVCTWGSAKTDTVLTNYKVVPTTDNNGSTSTGSNGSASLPSDNFSILGTNSYVDSVAVYRNMPYIPSPYKIVDGITYPNPEYYKTISGNNALSDFNGSGNTITLLMSLSGSTSSVINSYKAFHACNGYKDAVNSNTQWYLPACGELGYMLVRFKVINSTLSKLGVVQLVASDDYWSSSESSGAEAYYINMNNGLVGGMTKSTRCIARPWAVV